ncbi:MAG: choice-of-anchor L domain-containing protein [Ferruginibacter sp.]
MKITLQCLFLLITTTVSNAQLLITNEPNAVVLAQKLVGPGVSISNVTFTGNSLMAGHFKNVGGLTNIGLDSGIVLTTGSAKTIPASLVTGLDGDGVTTAENTLADTDWLLPGDASLATAIGANVNLMYDACVLEFDFIPSGDTVKFNYVFSSEEYTELYVCDYNDAFGFFISGPGITGVQNIALVPGTNIPVSIYNVNEVYLGLCPNNTTYFIDNVFNKYFTHDGQTVVLSALSPVQPCNTYHMKLVIADYGDGLLDSGVFLDGKSLTSTDTPYIKTMNAVVCNSNQLSVTFSENILCTTVQNADFSVTGPGGPYNVTGWTSPTCTTGSGTDFILTINPAITANGAFQLCLTNLAGSVTDACGNLAVPACLNFSVGNLVPTFNIPGALCTGSTAPILPMISNNGVTGTWNPSIVSNTATATYTFTPTLGQCATTTTITITVAAAGITPAFAPVSPFCGGALSPVLPLTSTNGINGTWSPSTVNNTTSGTYTFTPTAGQCATSTTLTVTVNANLIPAFSPVAPICAGSIAPTLPLTSTNGITGSWSPSTVSNTSSGIYAFTPAAGQCAASTTISVTVNTNVIPTFAAIASICSGSAAPVLPQTSTNGITGTWSPSTVNNTTSGTYTFTPSAGQCATSATLAVTVNPSTIPAFTPVAPICSGSATPILPLTSNNGITGTWSPSSVSNTTTGIYTFTPAAAQCATLTTLTVTVSSGGVVPVFAPVNPICSGSAAPVLPLISTNGINGIWSPSTVSNINSATYTFTPAAGQCAASTTLTVTVTSPGIVPAFPSVNPICSGSTAPVLPATSTNGITGTWTPSTVSNTNTATYTFTPTPGQCALTNTLTVTVTSAISPVFQAIAPICSGSVAPLLSSTSTNGITGTWNPSTISNTVSGTYIFTPSAGQCATTTTLSVTVTPGNIIPSFTPVGPICSGTVAPVLPTTSNNGISGTWTPATVSNTNSGTYTFTPLAGSCVATTTLSITVTLIPGTPTVTSLVNYCQAQQAVALSASGSGLLWFTTPTGGVGSITTPIPSTDNIGSTNFYVCQSNGTCEGPRAVVTVSVSPPPDLGPNKDLNICSGASGDLTLLYNTSGISSTWTYGQVSISDPATVTFPGIYQLIAINAAGCADTVRVNLLVQPPVIAFAGPDNDAEYNIPYQLNGSGGVQYQWSPATGLNDAHSTSPTATLTHDQTFILLATNEWGCSGFDTVKLRVLRGPTFYVPTAFTPNGDGLNDVFRATSIGIASVDFFMIFNRYGELIFETKDPEKGWDGKYKGKQQDPASYVWCIKGTDRTGQVKTMKGNVLLIR